MAEIRDETTKDETVAQLLRDLSRQTTTLVHQEVELAKAELGAKGRRMGAGAGLLGAAGVIALLGAGALVAAAIAGLATALSVWLSALIIGAVLLAVGGAIALSGKKEIQEAGPPVPTQAVKSTKEDVEWLKTQAQSAKP